MIETETEKETERNNTHKRTINDHTHDDPVACAVFSVLGGIGFCILFQCCLREQIQLAVCGIRDKLRLARARAELEAANTMAAIDHGTVINGSLKVRVWPARCAATPVFAPPSLSNPRERVL